MKKWLTKHKDVLLALLTPVIIVGVLLITLFSLDAEVIYVDVHKGVEIALCEACISALQDIMKGAQIR